MIWLHGVRLLGAEQMTYRSQLTSLRKAILGIWTLAYPKFLPTTELCSRRRLPLTVRRSPLRRETRRANLFSVLVSWVSLVRRLLHSHRSCTRRASWSTTTRQVRRSRCPRGRTDRSSSPMFPKESYRANPVAPRSLPTINHPTSPRNTNAPSIVVPPAAA